MKMIIHYVSGETQKWDFGQSITKCQEIREALFKTDFRLIGELTQGSNCSVINWSHVCFVEFIS